MDLLCPNCRATNPLGTVFCTKCRKKMDIRDINDEQVERSIKMKQYMLYAKIAAGVILLLVIVHMARLFWSLPAVGDTGTQKARISAEETMAEIVTAIENKEKEKEFTFTEAEVNGYLLGARERLGGPSVMMTVDLQNNYFVARLSKPRKQKSLPPASYEMLGTTMGKQLVPTKLRTGKVSHVGGGKRKVYSQFTALQSTATDQESFIYKNASSISFKDGMLIIKL